MSGVKNQHYVPRFYLKSFTDGTGLSQCCEARYRRVEIRLSNEARKRLCGKLPL